MLSEGVPTVRHHPPRSKRGELRKLTKEAKQRPQRGLRCVASAIRRISIALCQHRNRMGSVPVPLATGRWRLHGGVAAYLQCNCVMALCSACFAGMHSPRSEATEGNCKMCDSYATSGARYSDVRNEHDYTVSWRISLLAEGDRTPFFLSDE